MDVVQALPATFQYIVIGWITAAAAQAHPPPHAPPPPPQRPPPPSPPAQLLGDVLAASLASLFFLTYVTKAGYAGPLTPFRVALSCCFVSYVCFSPYQCPPLKIGLAISKLTMDPGRLHLFLALHTAITLFVLVPLGAVVVQNFN